MFLFLCFLVWPYNKHLINRARSFCMGESSPHKQCWTRVSRIFSDFQHCMRWGERELQENFEKDALFYKWTQNDKKKTEIYEYCITVRGTFVHVVGLKSGPDIRTRMLESLHYTLHLNSHHDGPILLYRLYLSTEKYWHCFVSSFPTDGIELTFPSFTAYINHTHNIKLLWL